MSTAEKMAYKRRTSRFSVSQLKVDQGSKEKSSARLTMRLGFLSNGGDSCRDGSRGKMEVVGGFVRGRQSISLGRDCCEGERIGVFLRTRGKGFQEWGSPLFPLDKGRKRERNPPPGGVLLGGVSRNLRGRPLRLGGSLFPAIIFQSLQSIMILCD